MLIFWNNMNMVMRRRLWRGGAVGCSDIKAIGMESLFKDVLCPFRYQRTGGFCMFRKVEVMFSVPLGDDQRVTL